jgi:hypothetical protein
MPISNTPTNTPFPLYETDMGSAPNRFLSIPTPNTLKSGALFGIPLRSFLTGDTVSDEAIQRYIDESISEIEHTLDLYITPIEFTERCDYNAHLMFWSFGYVKVSHGPILDVSSYQLTFNNGSPTPPLIDVPLEFIFVQPMEQTVQLVPATGTTISGFVTTLYSGVGFHAMNAGGITNWPGALQIRYRAGFENGKVPAVISGLVENMAAYKMLSVMGPVLFPYNSTSIGIDGTSQSVGTLGPAFLQSRLKDLQGIITQQMESARGYYAKRFLIDYL